MYPWSDILASVALPFCSSHHTLQVTSAQLVFGRNALLNLQSVSDWEEIGLRKQKDVYLVITKSKVYE